MLSYYLPETFVPTSEREKLQDAMNRYTVGARELDVFYSVRDGNFSDPTIWDTYGDSYSMIPTINSIVIIRHNVSLDASSYVNTLFVSEKGWYNHRSSAFSLFVLNVYAFGVIAGGMSYYNFSIIGDIFIAPKGILNDFNAAAFIHKVPFPPPGYFPGVRQWQDIELRPTQSIRFAPSSGKRIQNYHGDVIELFLFTHTFRHFPSTQIINSDINLTNRILMDQSASLDLYNSKITAKVLGIANASVIYLDALSEFILLPTATAFTVDGTSMKIYGPGILRLQANLTSTFNIASIGLTQFRFEANVSIENVTYTIAASVVHRATNPLVFHSVNGTTATSELKIDTTFKGRLSFQGAAQPMATGVLNVSGTDVDTYYERDGDQEIKGTTYYNLTLGGSGVKKLMGNVVVIGTYTLSGTATLDLNGFTLT